MIRIRVKLDPAGVLQYHKEDVVGLSPQEREGVWCGSACEPLGLREGAKIAPRDFALLLDGYDANGRSFLQRFRTPRRVAYDMVVSAAKPISVAALCWPEGGAVIRECFAAAARSLVGVAERLATRQGSSDRREKTGTLAAATFVHEASRYGDPHLHAHLVLGNVTWDGAFWSLGAQGIYQNHMTLDGMFQRDLAWRLARKGLKSEIRHGVAVLPVAEEVCRRLSRGRNAIEDAVERLGVSGARKKALEQVVNERLRPKKGRAETRNFDALLSKAEVQALRMVQGRARLERLPWDDRELRAWMRREIRDNGFETERARWDVALRAGWRDVGRPIHHFLDVALDGGLMWAGAERSERDNARRSAGVAHEAMVVAKREGVHLRAGV